MWTQQSSSSSVWKPRLIVRCHQLISHSKHCQNHLVLNCYVMSNLSIIMLRKRLVWIFQWMVGWWLIIFYSCVHSCFCHLTAHLANFNLTLLLFFSKCILQGWDMLTFNLFKCPQVVKKKKKKADTLLFAGAPLGGLWLVWSGVSEKEQQLLKGSVGCQIYISLQTSWQDGAQVETRISFRQRAHSLVLLNVSHFDLSDVTQTLILNLKLDLLKHGSFIFIASDVNIICCLCTTGGATGVQSNLQISPITFIIFLCMGKNKTAASLMWTHPIITPQTCPKHQSKPRNKQIKK